MYESDSTILSASGATYRVELFTTGTHPDQFTTKIHLERITWPRTSWRSSYSTISVTHPIRVYLPRTYLSRSRSNFSATKSNVSAKFIRWKRSSDFD